MNFAGAVGIFFAIVYRDELKVGSCRTDDRTHMAPLLVILYAHPMLNLL